MLNGKKGLVNALDACADQLQYPICADAGCWHITYAVFLMQPDQPDRFVKLYMPPSPLAELPRDVQNRMDRQLVTLSPLTFQLRRSPAFWVQRYLAMFCPFAVDIVDDPQLPPRRWYWALLFLRGSQFSSPRRSRW